MSKKQASPEQPESTELTIKTSAEVAVLMDQDFMEIMGAQASSQAATISTHKLFPQVGIQHQVANPKFELHDKTSESPLNTVIVNATTVRELYEEGNPVPMCTSTGGKFGTAFGECKDCKFHAWGSGKDGNGRACKEARKVLLYLPGKEGVHELKIPATSMAEFDRYKAQTILGFRGKPLSWHLTEMSLTAKSEKTRKWAVVGFKRLGDWMTMLPPADQKEVVASIKLYNGCYIDTPAPAGWSAEAKMEKSTAATQEVDADSALDEAMGGAAAGKKLQSLFETKD